jgi:hypothetical protein
LARSERAGAWYVALLGAAAAGALAVIYCLYGARREIVPSPAAAAIHGAPVGAAPRDSVAELGPPTGNAPPKKRYPKPGSFQKRLVEFYAGGGTADASNARSAFDAKPGKVIFNSAQLAALPDVNAPGYQNVGFGLLSAFKFDLAPEVVDPTANPNQASVRTRTQIPAEIQALDNHRVAIRGFLLPLKMDSGLAIEFLLLRDQSICCFGTIPRINEWISVRVTGKGAKPVMDQPITVLGTLHVGEVRENGYLVGLYQMDADQVLGVNSNPH